MIWNVMIMCTICLCASPCLFAPRITLAASVSLTSSPPYHMPHDRSHAAHVLPPLPLLPRVPEWLVLAGFSTSNLWCRSLLPAHFLPSAMRAKARSESGMSCRSRVGLVVHQMASATIGAGAGHI